MDFVSVAIIAKKKRGAHEALLLSSLNADSSDDGVAGFAAVAVSICDRSQVSA